MAGKSGQARNHGHSRNLDTRKARKSSRRRPLTVLVSIGLLLFAAGAWAAWLGTKASTVNTELSSAHALINPLKDAVGRNDPTQAKSILERLRANTTAAKEASSDPLWSIASVLPGLGPNFAAITEVARTADDVANLGLAPLVEVFESLDWSGLVPRSSGADLAPLRQAAPSVSSAAYAVRASAQRLSRIDETSLLPQVADPLTRAKGQLDEVTGTLDAAASAAQLLPTMLGAEAPRDYLLMIQNSAESRSSGGIPGALAVLHVDNGKLTLGAQSSASDLGHMIPPISVEDQQLEIYSTRMGTFLQDVNLTPDFPTAASTAKTMWETKKGQNLDGVVSIDPVVLAYVLNTTGPVKITDSELLALTDGKLPDELNGTNVVQTLLSDVYARVEQPKLQDAYFAGVAQEVFAALADGKGEASGLIEGITRGAQEGRVLLWSSHSTEQDVIEQYRLGGSVTGPSVSPAQFGVYFNDGTGAKMDYYIKRTVQLIQECSTNEYSQITVKVTSTNTAPSDAATSLPAYVTGGGAFGIAPGTVQTNVTAYGPVQANLAGASQGGQQVSVSSHRHDGRPVGTTTVTLAPGESSTIDIHFNKIVQHASPEVRVTPTVQDVRDVILDPESATCAPAG